MMLGCKGLRPLNLNTLFLVSIKNNQWMESFPHLGHKLYFYLVNDELSFEMSEESWGLLLLKNTQKHRY